MSDDKGNNQSSGNKSGGFNFSSGTTFNIGSSAQNNNFTVGEAEKSVASMSLTDKGKSPSANNKLAPQIVEMDAEVIENVDKLRKDQEKLFEIDEEYKKERILLEKKFLEKKKVLYEVRKNVVNGTVQGGSSSVIPQFWLNCLMQSKIIMIEECDIAVLEKLQDITVEYDDNFASFTLSFYFAKNEYFSNSVLTKKYGVSPDLLDDKSPTLTKCEGTEINWLSGKDVTHVEKKKKQKAKSGKNKGQTRVIVEKIPQRSFFHYFSTPKEELEEDEEGIFLDMEEDYEIGHLIRTAIVPEAVLWFTGEAGDGEEEEDEDAEYESDDQDDSEEEEDDDDDDDDEDDEPKGKGKPSEKGRKQKGKGKKKQDNEEKPECKQN